MPLMCPNGLGFRVLNLLENNIFLDRSLNYLFIYLKFIDQIAENHDKRRDPRKEVLKSCVSNVLPQSWMDPFVIWHVLRDHDWRWLHVLIFGINHMLHTRGAHSIGFLCTTCGEGIFVYGGYLSPRHELKTPNNYSIF